MTMYQDKWEQSIVSKRKQQIIGHSEGSLINSWDAPPQTVYVFEKNRDKGQT